MSEVVANSKLTSRMNFEDQHNVRLFGVTSSMARRKSSGSKIRRRSSKGAPAQIEDFNMYSNQNVNIASNSICQDGLNVVKGEMESEEWNLSGVVFSSPSPGNSSLNSTSSKTDMSLDYTYDSSEFDTSLEGTFESSDY